MNTVQVHLPTADNVTYKMQCTIAHSGVEAKSGHFVAYVASDQKERFIKLDDDNYTMNQSLQQTTKNMYALFASLEPNANM